ncbi:MAG TPA: SDR family oxidoreductase [Chitinophagales bacterium]|jgi:UDP-glucose 4-epimerase|nr:SDR family oxidoreductase [Chitinophagales bacterium]HQO90015.1 SDR family oxidoreductase [Chitinophagales bacterium]
MKVLITGGAGYLGTELVKKLVQIPKVKEIVVYDNLSKGIYNFFLCTCIGGDNIRFVQGDILDTRKLKKELKGVDIVFNLAAKIASPYADADPHLYEQINHWGTAELTYAIEESDVKKFVHVSSLSVYGASGKGKVITENTKLNPRTNYGISKMRGEGFVERLIKDKNIDTYIVRLGNVYGFNQTMRFDAVINRFAFEANFLKKISIHGDGQQIRSFIEVDKAAKYLTQLPLVDVPPGIYNMVDANKSIMDIALTFKDLIPELEMQFINQHLQLRHLAVEEDCKIYKYIPKVTTPFKDDLFTMLNQFAFH